MNVWWNSYEPALTDNDWLSSTGDGMWLNELWTSLRRDSMRIFNLSVGLYDDRRDYYENVKENLPPDVIVLSWRWEMPDYPQRQAAFIRQQELIDFAVKRNVPVLIHNSNLMPTIANAYEWAVYLDAHGCRVKLTAPLLSPPPEYTPLHFVCPAKALRIGGIKLRDRIYVGNNYGRYDSALEWFNDVDVTIHGNWLEPSHHRQTPAQVIQDFGHGPIFLNRLSQKLAIKELSRSRSTVHLAKPDYYRYGFLAYRWAEAAQAGTYAFVPHEFNGPDEVSEKFSADINVWKSQGASKNLYDEAILVEAQRRFVTRTMSAQPWHQILKELAT